MDQILDSPSNSERQITYAGFWIRVGAYFIDAIIVGVVNIIITFAVAGDINGNLATNVISLVLGVAYFSVMESSDKQGTIGKMAVGIKVGDRNGNRISMLNAIGRYFAKILSALILCIGFMMVGWDDRKQGLHDKLADTLVFYA